MMAAKILNVDDREINRYIRSQVLTAEGYEVVEADGGRKAIELCRVEKPELVLLDVNMPDISGIEVCRRIKEECVGGPVIVLQISATATRDDDYVHGLNSGADGYLTEPVPPPVLLATVRSMLRLRASEEALKERDAALRRLMDSNVVGIATANEDGIVDANGEFLRMIGASQQDLAAGWVNWKGITPPDQLVRDLHAIEELRERGCCTPFEKEYSRKDGARIPVLIGAAALSMDPLVWIAFAVDLAEQKRTELQLRRQADELARSNGELQRFAYFLSHDLQTPLRTVGTMSQLLARRYRESLPADAQALIDEIGSGVGRMNRLITDLLEYSKAAETGERKLTSIEAGALARWAVANLQAQIEESRATVEITETPAFVWADEQLSRVFQNLIGNAIKYRSSRPPRIEVTAELSGNDWVFAVRDNGIGFEMRYAERIFGVFQRLHAADHYGGTGIGLAICKRLVERYGGRMWVESVPDVGSTFFFAIPSAGMRSSSELSQCG